MASPTAVSQPDDYSVGFRSFTFEFDVRNNVFLHRNSWQSPIFTDNVTNYRWVAEFAAQSETSPRKSLYIYTELRLILHDSPKKSDLYVKCLFQLIENGIRRNLAEFRDILRSTSNIVERRICAKCTSNEVRISVTVNVECSDPHPVIPLVSRVSGITQSEYTDPVPPTCSKSVSSKPCMQAKLSNDMLAALNNGKYSDMRIEVADASIPVHRVILAARSPVFAAMFEQDMQEKREGRVEIRDFDLETVRHFVQFLYMGRSPCFTYELATELIRAADMYEVSDLKELCDEYLSTKCTESNCVNLLVIADRYGASRLKKCSVSFVCAHLDVLKKSDQIASLPNSLMAEIMLELASKMESLNAPSSSQK